MEWDYHITLCDINRYCWIVEDVEIRLDDDDAISLQLWVLSVTIGLVQYTFAAYHWDCPFPYVIFPFTITHCITRFI